MVDAVSSSRWKVEMKGALKLMITCRRFSALWAFAAKELSYSHLKARILVVTRASLSHTCYWSSLYASKISAVV